MGENGGRARNAVKGRAMRGQAKLGSRALYGDHGILFSMEKEGRCTLD